ncbi:MAG: hypothetical protein R3F11_13825 [Verrucomicrobiales bacterium]
MLRHALGAIGVLAAMFATGDRQHGIWFLGILALHLVFRIWRYSHVIRLSCQLCHCPILHSRRCHKHRNATKLPLIGHRASAALEVFFRHGFTCMYCGTKYRLWR